MRTDCRPNDGDTLRDLLEDLNLDMHRERLTLPLQPYNLNNSQKSVHYVRL